MKRKKAVCALAVVCVLIILGVIFHLVFAPGIILSAAERTASFALDSEVTIKSMTVSPARGAIKISGIAIANIEGYDAQHILTVGSASARFSPLSYFSGTLKIREIRVDDVRAEIQQKGTRINLLEFQSKLSRREAEEEIDADSGLHLTIDIIEISGVFLNIDILGRKTSLRTEPIILENIGTENDINAPLLFTRVFAAIISGAARQVRESLPGASVPEDAGERIRGVLDRFRSPAE